MMKFKDFDRRTLLKGMASLPVLGLFGYEFLRKELPGKKEPIDILKELGIDQNMDLSGADNASSGSGQLIRLGIIGAGTRGKTLLFRTGFAPKERVKGMNAEQMEAWMDYGDLNVVVTGVCDVFDDRAELALDAASNSVKAVSGEKNLPKAKRYQDYQELLASDDIDAVIIATPDHHHVQMTIDAINAGKHVYCEKAPTRTEAEAYQLYEAIKDTKLVYQLGHQIRHNPIYPYAANLVNQGVLGAVNLVEVTTNRNTSSGAWVRHVNRDGSPKPGDIKSIDWERWLGDRPKVPFSTDRYYNWTKYWDYANGLLGQLFSHEYDAVNGILDLGIPHSCMCSGGIYYYEDGREIPDLMHSVFEYPDKGMSLVYSATLANSRNRGRVIMGRDASMEIGGSIEVIADGNSKRYKDVLDKKLIDSNKPFVTAGAQKDVDGVASATEKYYIDRGLTEVKVNGKSQDVTHLHLREWLNVIRNGGKVSCGLDNAFDEAITIQMAKKSYTEGRRVKWDPVIRRIV